MATGFFNQDRAVDVVTVNQDSNSLSVLLGRGDGSFFPEISWGVGANPRGLAIGDFDGDGHMDIVCANHETRSLTVLLGLGNGQFVPREPITLQFQPRSVAVGDFDHDGATDIVGVGPDPDRVVGGLAVLLTGAGDGTFVETTVYETDFNVLSVQTGDFNHDDWLDLITVGAHTGVGAIWLGGPGAFAAPRPFATTAPLQATIADFDRDGHQDVATLNAYTSDVTVFYGDGAGSFGPAHAYEEGSERTLIAGDFSNDGWPDVAVTRELGLSLLLGHPDRRLLPPARLSVGSHPMTVLTADVNNDSLLDILTANDNTADVSILLGRGDGTFQPETRIPTFQASFGMAVGDFNNDGRSDFATTAAVHTDDISIQLGRGDGTFIRTNSYPVGKRPVALQTADLDADRILDLVSANEHGQSVSMFRKPGTKEFDAPRDLETAHQALLAPGAVQLTDLDRDSLPDLVVVNSLGKNVLVFQGLGNGQFARRNRMRWASIPWPRPLPISMVTAFSISPLPTRGPMMSRHSWEVSRTRTAPGEGARDLGSVPAATAPSMSRPKIRTAIRFPIWL
jgi:hypothetical protein